MSVYQGRLEPVGRIAVIVSLYHERITRKLLQGARQAMDESGLNDADGDVFWVSGAFELGVMTSVLAESGSYQALVALGVVVRGETPHFDFVAGEASRVLAETARRYHTPVGFGLLTCDTMAQAEARAGGDAGNKGYDAAVAAITTASLLAQKFPRSTGAGR